MGKWKRGLDGVGEGTGSSFFAGTAGVGFGIWLLLPSFFLFCSAVLKSLFNTDCTLAASGLGSETDTDTDTEVVSSFSSSILGAFVEVGGGFLDSAGFFCSFLFSG